MKIAFTVFLVLNFLVEALAAATLISGPMGLGATEAVPGGMWAMHYGFAVIAIASALIWLWPYRDNRAAVTAVLGMLMTFHCVLLASLLMEGVQQAGIVIHSVMAVLAIVLFALRSRWCK
ncbi:MAG: hypothetical protein AB8B93_08845 [Pseudomonadales bacterium]